MADIRVITAYLQRVPGEVVAEEIVDLDHTYNNQNSIDGFHLKGEMMKIGRGLDNDIVINDIKISRHHAELLYIFGKWYLKDLSSNGILKNGSRVVRDALFELKDRDVIQFVPDFVTNQFKYLIMYNLKKLPESSTSLPGTAPPDCLDLKLLNKTASAPIVPIGRADLNQSIDIEEVTPGHESLSPVRTQSNPGPLKETLLISSAGTPAPDYVQPSSGTLNHNDTKSPMPSSHSSVPNLITEVRKEPQPCSSSRIDPVTLNELEVHHQRSQRIGQYHHRIDLTDSENSDSDDGSISLLKTCEGVLIPTTCVNIIDSPILTNDSESVHICNDSTYDGGQESCVIIESESQSEKENQTLPDSIDPATQQLMLELRDLKNHINKQIDKFKTDSRKDERLMKRMKKEITDCQTFKPEEKFSADLLGILRLEFSCSLCLEIFIEPHIVFPCGHTFCGFCVSDFIATSKKNVCPNCKIPLESVNRHCSLENFIDTSFALLPENDQLRREASKEGRGKTQQFEITGGVNANHS